MSERSITCPRCGRTSYHPEDIRQRYCGFCHQFHRDMAVNPTIDPSNPAVLGALAKGDIGNAMVASTPGGIEKQEALGQIAFNNSDVLPIEIVGIGKDELEARGFHFGKTVDECFQQATLPTGWTKRAAGPDGSIHSMWNYVYDETGKQRATIFYKAAFYDRSATFYWEEK